MLLLSFVDFFSKNTQEKILECQTVNPTLCRSRSGFRLFANIRCRRQKLPLFIKIHVVAKMDRFQDDQSPKIL